MSRQASKSPSLAFITQLREKGLKITTTRKHLVEIVVTFDHPFTAEELLQEFTNSGKAIHRATIYRDLHLFVQKELLKEFSFQGASAQYYEVASGVHHHHFVCQKCFTIIDVIPEQIESELRDFEHQLRLKGLNVTQHHLKFYGFCSQCSVSNS